MVGKGDNSDDQVQLADFGGQSAQTPLTPTEEPSQNSHRYEERKLDDVMLAMDVVDTLRHDAALLEKDLSKPEREQQLIDRLREIYKNQGIDVPDRILREGVQALEDHRFAYTPYKGSWLSRLYISRGKWGRPVLVALGMVALAVGLEYTFIEMPKHREARRVERVLNVDYPNALREARDGGLAIAATSELKDRINALYQEGVDALANRDVDSAKKHVGDINDLVADIRKQYTLRIVSRPGENSGVFRVHDDDPNVRNYYLIVEGLDANGRAQTVNIVSEEDQTTKRTTIWGVRVPEEVFYRVAADKKDDQIIQNAVIGVKKRGYLVPEYSIETGGGLIVEW